MVTISLVFLWLSLIALLHTYLFYPLLVIFLARKKEGNQLIFEENEFPSVSIIMAVHNEEKIIAKKIESIINSDYDKNKITFFIGSDASTDKTNQIIESYAKKFPCIVFENFHNRCGKIHIINELSANSDAPIIVFTDANSLFDMDALRQVIKHFKNPDVKIVGGRLRNLKTRNNDIALQEHAFMENEFKVKIAEGKLWGTMMGAYGAFYAVRRDAFSKVPDTFLVDDFYISLKAIENKGKAICEPMAIAYEDVSGDLEIEFRRKLRIAAGNFQNLRIFYPLLFSRRFGLAFCFFSHKVLRWLGPIFLILLFISVVIVFQQNYFYTILLILIMLSWLVPIIDYFNRKSRIHIIILRFITHFYYMNAALLLGLFNFMKGVKSNVWEPTKR